MSISEARDNVYSLLKLTGDREADLVAATYDDGIAAAFAKATYASIITSGTYGILGFLNFANPRPPRVPTRALNFSRGGDGILKHSFGTAKSTENPSPGPGQGGQKHAKSHS